MGQERGEGAASQTGLLPDLAGAKKIKRIQGHIQWWWWGGGGGQAGAEKIAVRGGVSGVITVNLFDMELNRWPVGGDSWKRVMAFG